MSSREQFEAWGMSDPDLSETLKSEVYASIAWMAWQAASKASEQQLAAVVAECAGLNNFISKSCYVRAGDDSSWHPAIDHSPETPATNQLSTEESQFLTDVITAAGLLSCGKQDKGLARRITDFCVEKIGNSNPAQLRQGAAL
ncbi:hypothetical protein [Kluyvera intermedia]|uniref:Uncharacterized protein n=1 Tax=Kluyvera intermedia TaxID=61648 RepID=A0ABX6DTJ8_KLUIN|nr:hypothetical protein [Kluyvera intermedia]QGH31069.1 hypothetical protein GHC21_15955 [Kluyvera intermedia]QGH40051.1 hypothetical protein GHC38_15955 [Kluyvera intermedia]